MRVTDLPVEQTLRALNAQEARIANELELLLPRVIQKEAMGANLPISSGTTTRLSVAFARLSG
jgi:hypothetical protein